MGTNLPDSWLENWSNELRTAARDLPVLELGCDTGQDTSWLVTRGFSVVATDLSTQALQMCARTASPKQCLHHDLREPLPMPDESFGVVIASLCLHYFDWASTIAAVEEIRRCIKPPGLVLIRVNSVRDYLHGAGQGEEIEPRFYRQNARFAASKRFFNSEDLDRLFSRASWHELSRREVTIHRYAQPKVAWELALSRA